MGRRPITFLTRSGCPLCDEVLPRVRSAARWSRRELVVEDIAGHPELEAEYHLRVPVVLSDDGRVLAEGEIGAWAAIKAAVQA